MKNNDRLGFKPSDSNWWDCWYCGDIHHGKAQLAICREREGLRQALSTYDPESERWNRQFPWDRKHPY